MVPRYRVGGLSIVVLPPTEFIMSHFQLGGKDPAYVRADADFDYTVSELVDGESLLGPGNASTFKLYQVHSSTLGKAVVL